MSGLDRWVWVIKVIGTVFSTLSAILTFRQQLTELWKPSRKKKQKSPHRCAR